jgi:hypothetical protein
LSLSLLQRKSTNSFSNISVQSRVNVPFLILFDTDDVGYGAPLGRMVGLARGHVAPPETASQVRTCSTEPHGSNFRGPPWGLSDSCGRAPEARREPNIASTHVGRVLRQPRGASRVGWKNSRQVQNAHPPSIARRSPVTDIHVAPTGCQPFVDDLANRDE